MSSLLQVADFSWPNRQVPELERIVDLCRSLDSWLRADPQNVIVIHCQVSGWGGREGGRRKGGREGESEGGRKGVREEGSERVGGREGGTVSYKLLYFPF